MSRTLNACTAENVTQLGAALTVILRQHSQCYQHDYARGWQILEVLELAENKRAATIVRVDAGGGEDEAIDWPWQRHDGVLAKVKSWRRAQKLAASVTDWQVDPKVPEREVGWVTAPHL